MRKRNNADEEFVPPEFEPPRPKGAVVEASGPYGYVKVTGTDMNEAKQTFAEVFRELIKSSKKFVGVEFGPDRRRGR